MSKEGITLRKLVFAAAGFGAACLITAYRLLPFSLLWAALAFAAAGASIFLLKNRILFRPAQIAAFGAAVGFLLCSVFNAAALSGARELVSSAERVTAQVCGWPEQSDTGWWLTVKADTNTGKSVKVRVFFRKDMSGVRVGDSVTFTGDFRDASLRYGEYDVYWPGRGVFVTAYCTDDDTVIIPCDKIAFRHYPAYAARALQKMVLKLYPGEAGGLMSALLTGSREYLDSGSSFSYNLRRAGVYHIVAVSGLHVSFLAALAFTLTRRRTLSAIIGIPLILFFMAMTGFSPSVVRAGVMQIMLLGAPLLGRESDPPTSLALALIIILAVNPYAAASVSLQLSFAATAGILFATPHLTPIVTNLLAGRRGKLVSILRSIGNSLATTFGAMLFSVPLSAVVFGYVSVLSPIANLLVIWPVSIIFSLGLLSCVLGFIFMPLGKVIAFVPTLLIRWVRLAASLISGSGFAAVSADNPAVIIWLCAVYLLLIIFIIYRQKIKKLFIPCTAAVAALCAILVLTPLASATDDMKLTVLDVGQGQCILVRSGNMTCMIDCGSHDSRAGDIAAAELLRCGITRLDALIITHYDADHANGVRELMYQTDVSCLVLPEDYECDSGLDGEVIALANQAGAGIIYNDSGVVLTIGQTQVTVYPPPPGCSDNDRGNSVVCTSGDYDVLITGDITAAAERLLISTWSLPDIEVFVAGHHGSRHSTSPELLDALTPEYVLISVGRHNSYGHPTQQVLDRLSDRNITVLRTDIHGSITVSPQEER